MHLGSGQSRADGVDIDTVGRHFQSQSLGQRVDSGLGRTVQTGEGVANLAVEGAGGDDGAGTLLLHLPGGVFAGEYDALQIHAVDLVDQLFGDVGDGPLAAVDAGVGVQDVDAAELFNHGVHQRLDLGLLGHVDFHGEAVDVGALLLDLGEGLMDIGQQVRQDHMDALFCQSLGSAEADAPGSAGNDGHLAGNITEFGHGIIFLSL